MANYLPDARKNIVEMLEAAMKAWLVEMQEQSFSDPYEDESLHMMLEATATAIGDLLEKNPNRDALLRTFALDILDNTKEETK